MNLTPADRLRAWIRDYGHEKQPQFIADLTEALDALLRLVPVDDGEAIEEDWLNAVGFDVNSYKQDPVQLAELRIRNDKTPYAIEVRRRNGLEVHVAGIVFPHIKTRGQLRRLCAALGIELKEDGQ